MKILIIGASGQLGCDLVQQAFSCNVTVETPTRQQMDITKISQIEKTITKMRPSLVINAAAYTNVDKAETEPELAFAVNKTGIANLAQSCCERKIPLIHISTDYVFNGKKGKPYVEKDSTAPLGVYGQSKAEGEEKLRSILKAHIILRTSWLYGVFGHNFVKTILKLSQQNEEISVVADQYGSPTSATDLAEALLKMAFHIVKKTKVFWGTYHYCGEGITTWHEFAGTILAMAKFYGSIRTHRVKPITTDEFPTPARRPAFTALDCSRIKKNFGIIPKPWQASLQQTIGKIFSGNE